MIRVARQALADVRFALLRPGTQYGTQSVQAALGNPTRRFMGSRPPAVPGRHQRIARAGRLELGRSARTYDLSQATIGRLSVDGD
jgi:hypothetical protein